MTTDVRTLLLATSNPGKVREYEALLAPLGLQVVGLQAHPEVRLPEETGTTFEENARIKASAAARASGRVALADDSGLCVDPLGGAPGIRSARFGGEGLSDRDRCTVLLRALDGVPMGMRTASFHCVIAVARPDGQTRCARGETRGLILEQPHGTGGFGYDPLFFVPELSRTYAQLGETDKDRISHRGRAVVALEGLLAGWPGLWS